MSPVVSWRSAALGNSPGAEHVAAAAAASGPAGWDGLEGPLGEGVLLQDALAGSGEGGAATGDAELSALDALVLEAAAEAQLALAARASSRPEEAALSSAPAATSAGASATLRRHAGAAAQWLADAARGAHGAAGARVGQAVASLAAAREALGAALPALPALQRARALPLVEALAASGCAGPPPPGHGRDAGLAHLGTEPGGAPKVRGSLVAFRVLGFLGF